jgi:putative membrane protein
VHELGLVVPLVVTATAYATTVEHFPAARTRVEPWRAIAFIDGLVVVAVALLSPLHDAAERTLWTHMVQHILLISVAAPLLAMGRPLAVANAWLGVRPPALRARGVVLLVVVAASTQVATLLAWHTPALYDAAVVHQPVHELEHATLLGSAVLLWVTLEHLADRGGLAVLVVFAVSLPPMVLGVGMTFARSLWYPAYADRVRDPLADQQLAGAVMWAYGGVAAAAGGIYLFARWLRALERSSPGRPTPEPDLALRRSGPC